MKGRKRIWWILTFLLVILAAAVWMHWDMIILRSMPKVVLSKAFSNAYSQLEERFQNHPLWIPLKSIDAGGEYTADVVLTTSNEILGSVVYDMTVQVNGDLHQLLAEGTASTERKSLDLSVYLDEKFMALSSDDLVRGNYYGITYDTFLHDIRSIPLLDYFVSERMLSQWDASVQKIKSQMMQSYMLPEIPNISEEDVNLFLIALMALPCETERSTVSLPEGFTECYVLSYYADGEEIKTLLADTPYAEISRIEAKFYLQERTLVKMTLSFASGSNHTQVSLDLGQQPKTNALQFRVLRNNSGITKNYTAVIDTKETDSRYGETWEITSSSDAGITIGFNWEKNTNVLCVTRDEIWTTECKLRSAENGFQLETENFQALLRILQKEPLVSNTSAPMVCNMTMAKGANILVPEYRNLDQWSIEDFLILLEGIGSLIGLRLN